jgi:hypothetical protein
MAQLLYSSTYKKPGVYIGQIIEPSADSIGTAARIPVMIGKGSRYAQATNKAVVRAYVYEEELDDITSSAPYIATLKHPALKDQSRAELVRKSDGYVIPDIKWQFGDDLQSIIISEDVYLADDEYTLSYQSTDRTVLDPTPVYDIISVGACGSSLSTNNFVENRDYYIIMTLDNLKKANGDTFVDTDDLEFDPRYNSASIYPVSSSSVAWLSVDSEKYLGIENLSLSLRTELITHEETPEGASEPVTVTDGVTIKNTSDETLAEITEIGTFVALTGYEGIKVAVSSFVADSFTINVTAGKIFPTAKDNRKVTFTITNVDTSGEEPVYTIYYASNTPEGGFGTVESSGNRIILPGNIILKIADGVTLTQGAKYSLELTNTNTIDWNLTLKVSQYFRTDSVYRDVNGSKTGIVGAYYVILNGTPIEEPTSEGVELSWIDGTPYVVVSYPSDSANAGKKPQNFSISYEYAGNEPNPGDTYYLTTKHVRPDSMYNKVIFISSRAEGQVLLAPSTSKNDLYIANEIAWDEIGARTGYQIAYIQIKDSDDDGVLSSADVQAAIDALATSKKTTDFCLLGNFEYLKKLLAANEFGNNPFECHENEVWVGAPVGTEVGDINTEDSLVYIAQNTMKVYGNENPAHGTRVLVAPTEATKKITLEGNVEQSIKLDGSFVSWGLACHRSRMKPADSIMREVLIAFDSMQTFDDVDDIKLGQNQIVYFSKVSDGMYRVEEDFTTDKYGFEFSLEQITSQRFQVVRDLRDYMNESLIGYTPDTPAVGIETITSYLVTGLNQKIREGVISHYLDENGNKRPLDPSTDIFVTNIKENPTQYQFGYGFYTKKVMKVLFGSYVVDKNFVDTGLGN